MNLTTIPFLDHPTIEDDTAENSLVARIGELIDGIIKSIDESFAFYCTSTIPSDMQTITSPLLTHHWKHSQRQIPGTLPLPTLSMDLAQDHTFDWIERMYTQLVFNLVFSACSESSCERIFSRARFIIGKRRYQLSLLSLYSSLLVSSEENRKLCEVATSQNNNTLALDISKEGQPEERGYTDDCP